VIANIFKFLNLYMTYYRSHSIRVTSTTELGEAESLLVIYLISSYKHYSRRLSFKKRVEWFISLSNTLGLFSSHPQECRSFRKTKNLKSKLMKTKWKERSKQERD